MQQLSRKDENHKKNSCAYGKHATVYMHTVPVAVLTFKVIQGQ